MSAVIVITGQSQSMEDLKKQSGKKKQVAKKQALSFQYWAPTTKLCKLTHYNQDQK